MGRCLLGLGHAGLAQVAQGVLRLQLYFWLGTCLGRVQLLELHVHPLFESLFELLRSYDVLIHLHIDVGDHVHDCAFGAFERSALLAFEKAELFLDFGDLGHGQAAMGAEGVLAGQ
jgi:hypothetical protein